MTRQISQCRISGSTTLLPVLNLGEQVLTGVFPRSTNQAVTRGPLELVWCPDSMLLQLHHSFDLTEMYGQNYGYRSGLNASMVAHLTDKIRHLTRLRPVHSGDLVVDIGSNDATTLKAYDVAGPKRLGVDPTGIKFREFYTDGLDLIPDFFSGAAVTRHTGGQRAQIVTSISMFYDLESPQAFVNEIASILAPDGIWHFEQSYMPSMLRTNSYDTICHEHLEYYSLIPVRAMLAKAGLKVVDVQMNAINGGSFAVTAAHTCSSLRENTAVIEWLIQQEESMGLFTPRPFREFETRVFAHRANLLSLIKALVADGKKIIGYGASTKGNVLLQFCGLTPAEIPCIADVNPDKFGAFTPGTHIPIVSEAMAKAMNPDYFFVLPWHFKSNIIQREKEWLAGGGKMIFPLPEIEIV